MEIESRRSLPAGDLGFILWAIIANVVAAILAFDQLAVLTPVRVLLLSVGLTWALVRACGFKAIDKDGRPSWWLAAAALAALFFASDTSPHYFGGQDQGYYTAMAELFARGEPLTFVDHFRAQLSPELRVQYDKFDLPSVAYSPRGMTSILFYPLHPALMALATQLFGAGHHTASMAACFMIAVAAAYFLTFELTNGNRRLAALVAWLFALNPALVFFSKFPVSEITATALLLPAAYHLLAGFRATDARMSAFHGIGTVLFFNAYCLTRMSFPMLGIFAGLMTLIVLVRPEFNRRDRIYITTIMTGIAAACGLSLVYYVLKQPRLFSDTMQAVYLPALERVRWPILLLAAVLLSVAVLSLFPALRARILTVSIKLTEICERWILRYPALVLLVLSVPSLAVLVRTGTFPGMHVGGGAPGWQMLRFHPLYVLILMLSPFLFGSLLRIHIPPGNRLSLIPVTYLVVTWPAFMSFTAAMPWLYYFGRRLLPEILPFALIAAVIVLFQGRMPRRLKQGIAGLALAWSAVFSVVQIGTSDGEVGRPFHDIAAHLHKRDVLIISASEFDYWERSGIVIPLRYSLGISTFISDSAKAADLLDSAAQIRAATLSKVYILSKSDLSPQPELQSSGAHVIDKITLRTQRLMPGWCRSVHYPTSVGWCEFLLPTSSVVLQSTALYLSAVSTK
jgi:hypothetical protein